MKRKLPNQVADLLLLTDARRRTALHIAAEHNRLEISRYLLRRADEKFINARDIDGKTALHTAARLLFF